MNLLCLLPIVLAPVKASEEQSMGPTLLDEIVLQHGHTLLDSMSSVNVMSHDHIEYALSKVMYKTFLDPSQDMPVSKYGFQISLIQKLLGLWRQTRLLTGGSASSSLPASLQFEECRLMLYLRQPIHSDDGFHSGHHYVKRHRKSLFKPTLNVALMKLPERERPSEQEGLEFMECLMDALPGTTVGNALLLGGLRLWVKTKDAGIKRLFTFACLQLSFKHPFLTPSDAICILKNLSTEGKDLQALWPKLFDPSEYDQETFAKATGDEQRLKKLRHEAHTRLLQKYCPIVASTIVFSTPFLIRDLLNACTQPLMLMEAFKSGNCVLQNIAALLSDGINADPFHSHTDNFLVSLRYIAKTEESVLGNKHEHPVAKLFVKHLSVYFQHRNFTVSADFYALPLDVQRCLLDATRPEGTSEDPPANILGALQGNLAIIRQSIKQAFSNQELQEAHDNDGLALEVISLALHNQHVLLHSEEPRGTRPETLREMVGQALWNPGNRLPLNQQYAAVVEINGNKKPILQIELLVIPETSTRRASVKVKKPSSLNAVAIQWDGLKQCIHVQRKMPVSGDVCGFDVLEFGNGFLRNRMLIVLTRFYELTEQEAMNYLTLSDRQLQNASIRPSTFEPSVIITVRPSHIPTPNAPTFPTPADSRWPAIVSDFIQAKQLQYNRHPPYNFVNFILRVGSHLLAALLTTSSAPEQSRAAWIHAISALEASSTSFLQEKAEKGSDASVKDTLIKHSWTYQQLLDADMDVQGLPVIMRFTWHYHRLLLANMLSWAGMYEGKWVNGVQDLAGFTLDGFGISLTRDDTTSLATFFEVCIFKNNMSSQAKADWLQAYQRMKPLFDSTFFEALCYFDFYSFDSAEEPPHDAFEAALGDIPPVTLIMQVTLNPIVDHACPVLPVVTEIIGSPQAQSCGFVNFVPHFTMDGGVCIVSNKSQLHWAIVDGTDPSKQSTFDSSQMGPFPFDTSCLLIAHHCPQALAKLLSNFAAYRKRGLLVFALVHEHFLVYTSSKKLLRRKPLELNPDDI